MVNTCTCLFDGIQSLEPIRDIPTYVNYITKSYFPVSSLSNAKRIEAILYFRYSLWAIPLTTVYTPPLFMCADNLYSLFIVRVGTVQGSVYRTRLRSLLGFLFYINYAVCRYIDNRTSHFIGCIYIYSRLRLYVYLFALFIAFDSFKSFEAYSWWWFDTSSEFNLNLNLKYNTKHTCTCSFMYVCKNDC